MPDKRVSQQRVSDNPPNRDVNAVARVSMAVTLRAQKLTYDEIAKKTGFAGAGSCRKAVMRELERCVSEDVAELRREELASLEVLEALCWKRALSKDYEKSQMFAVDRIVAIKERRARLMGLDVKPDAIPDGITIIREYGVTVTEV
jgi:hypothetical protein